MGRRRWDAAVAVALTCEYADPTGAEAKCDDGPVVPLTFIFNGAVEVVDLCGKHRRIYHQRLLPFKANSRPAGAVRYSNDKIDEWGQPWTVAQIRYWLKVFADIEVGGRARLHPDRHITPWKNATKRDKGLLGRVITSMQNAKSDARDLFRNDDPQVGAMVRARVADVRAGRASQPLFLPPEDEH